FRAVPVVDRDKHQIRGGADPNAAETDLQAAYQVELLQKHGPLVEVMVAVGVFEHQDPVCAAEDVLELFGRWFAAVRASRPIVRGRIAVTPRVGVALGDPDAPA